MKFPKWFRRKRVQIIAQQRTFKAGAPDEYDVNWTTSPASIDNIIFERLDTLRARSREQSTNNEYAIKFLRMLKSHVIGAEGVQMQVESENQQIAGRIEGAWRRWSAANNCDYEGRQNLHQLLKLSLSTIATDGECLIRYRRGSFAFGLRLELVDPVLLPVRDNTNVSNDRIIRFGIEFFRRRAFRYRIKNADTLSRLYGTPQYGQYRDNTRLELVSSDDILHLFMSEYVGQKRGIPWFAVPLKSMRQLTAYSDAALTNAREAASKQGFISMSNPADMPADFVNEAGQKFANSEPGEWHILPEGAQLHTYDPNYPNNEYDPFHKSMLRRVASGLGVSYNTLANDLEGVNFSSMRHGAIEEREVYKEIQAFMIAKAYEPIYREWLDVQVLQETIPGLTQSNVDDYRRVKWMPRRWAWVDPLAEGRANEIGVRMGWQTISQVIRESGRDPEDVFAEREADLKRLDKSGYPADIENLLMQEDETDGQSATAVSDE